MGEDSDSGSASEISWILNNWVVKALEAICLEFFSFSKPLSRSALGERGNHGFSVSSAIPPIMVDAADCRQNKASSCWAEMATKPPVPSTTAESEVAWLLQGDNCTHPSPCPDTSHCRAAFGKYSAGCLKERLGGSHLPPRWFPYVGTKNLVCLRAEGNKNHVYKKHKEIKA